MKVLIVSADRTMSTGHPSNLGDALLTDALAEAVRVRGLDPVVADFGARRTIGGEPRLQLASVWQLARAIRTADVVIVGGGTLFQDDSPRLVGGLPRLLFVTSLLSRLLGRPLAYFGVGADPVGRAVPRALLRLAVRGRHVWARDRASADRLRRMGAGRVELAADVSLALASQVPLAPESRSGPTAAPGAVVALAAADGPELSVQSLERLRGAFGAVTFVQMYQGDVRSDASTLTPEVLALVPVTSGLSWEAARDVFATADVVIASRMHALYLGVLLDRPVVAVGSLPKVVAFAEEFGVARFDDVNSAVESESWRLADGAALRAARERVGWAVDRLVAPLVTHARGRSRWLS